MATKTTDSSVNVLKFPRQKISRREKTDDWAIENIKAGIAISNYDPGKMRKTKDQMDLNYRLISGDFDESDIDKSLNPMGFKGVNFPAKVQNYPIELTKIGVLKGEEVSRPFNWFLRATNDHVVIDKQERESAEVQNYIASAMVNRDLSESQIKRDLTKMKRYYTYDYQDLREEMGTRLLEHIWGSQKVPVLTSEAFYDIVTVAEEVYACDIFHGVPKNRKVRPNELSVVGNGNSIYIEDSMIFVEDTMMNVGSVQDLFFDELTDEQVKMLDEGSLANKYDTSNNLVIAGPVDLEEEYAIQYGTQLIPISSKDTFKYGGSFDEEGNVRVIRVVWKSKTKVGRLTYYDDDGEEQYDYVSEDYKPNESLGEKIKWEWISEWWQGYRIGNDIYVKMERLPRLGMTYENPSKVLPPYVGTIYTMGNKAYSLIDRIRPYKYLYNITMTRAEMASARNKGVLAEMDLARIPEGWEPDIWMMYAELNGYFITDSFKQGNEGAATGRLLATLNNRGPSSINLDASQVIISNLEFARYIKNEINEITGITPQREGMMGNRETLGGINRSLQQSTFITEEYFYIHDNTKLRLLELNLETAKHCYKNEKLSLSVMDDGLIRKALEVDGAMLADTSFGYYLSDGRNDLELINFVKQYGHAALQNDKAKFKDIFEVMKTKSIAAIGNRLQEAEQDAEDERQHELQTTLQQQRQMAMDSIKWDQMKFQQEQQIKIKELETRLREKMIDVEMLLIKTDAASQTDRQRIEGEIDNMKAKIKLEYDKLQQKNEEFNKQLAQERDQFNKEIRLERQKLSQPAKTSS